MCCVLFAPCVAAQSKPAQTAQISDFKDLLAGINGSFTFPDNFVEVKSLSTDKVAFQYGIKQQDAEFEIWFQVNSLKADWQKYETTRQGINPDSLYTKVAADDALALSGSKDYLSRPMPPSVLERYNADAGRSYLLTLADLPATKHYQYALLIVLQKSRYGNIMVACLTNDKGPAFFRNINQLRYCFKFNN